jgi:peptidoglycan/LPS O-acetylase OafA/YrhL
VLSNTRLAAVEHWPDGDRTSRDWDASTLRAASSPAVAEKLLGLEIMRFIAAFSILFWHYQNFWWTPFGVHHFVGTDEPLHRFFFPLYEFGRYAVQVFWVISGYIFFWKYRRTVAGRSIGPRTFFVLRFSRLYPLHLGTLLLVAALQWWYVRMQGVSFVYGQNDGYHFLLQLFLASNWGFERASSFNGPIWSISIEVLVYALFFVVLRHLGSHALQNVVIILAALGAYLLTHHNPIFECVVCFYLGGMSAIVAGTRLAREHRAVFLGLALGVLAVSGAGAMLVDAFHIILFHVDLAHVKFVIQFLITSGIAALVYVMAEHVRVPPALVGPVRNAGNLTYSTYLIHFPVQLAVAVVYTAMGAAIPRQSVLFFGCYIVLVLVLAGALYRFLEVPCQSLLRRRLLPPRAES